MAEEILISIELEKGDNEKRVDNLTRKITDLTKANNDLKKSNNDLVKAGKENSAEYVENTRQLEINKQKITEATASRKNLINTIIAEDDSIKGLKARNAELIKQRDLLSTSTAEGRQRISEINEELDKNNNTIRENSSQLEKQKINIGNYSSALDAVMPGLGSFANGLQSASAMAKGLWVSLGPVALILGAIGLALSPVIGFLKDTGDGMDFVEEKTTGLSTGFQVLRDNFNALGRDIVEGEGTIGKFAQAFVKANPLVQAFNYSIALTRKLLPGLASDFDEATEAGEAYARAMDSVNTESAFFEATAKAEENAIKQLILQSKNRTLTEQERIALIEEASEREEKLVRQRINFTTEAARHEINLANQRAQLQQRDDETLKDFGLRVARVIDSIGSEEQRNKILDAIKSIDDAQAQSIALQEKLQNQKDALSDKEQERLDKEAQKREQARQKAEKERQDELAAIQKQNEEIAAAEQEQFKANEEFLKIKNVDRLNAIKEQYLAEAISKQEFEKAITDAELLALEERKAFLEANGEETAEIEQQIIDRRIKAKESELAANLKIEKAKLDNEKAVTQARIGLVGQIGQTLSALAGKNKLAATAGIVIEKAAALGQIVSNTAIANAKAVAASPLTFGQPWVTINTVSGILAGVNVVSEAAKSLSDINSVKGFARGGLSGTRVKNHHGIPITRSNGDNILATVKTGEVILNKDHQAMLGGDATFRKIGVPGFAGSGFAGDNTTQQAAQVADGRTALRNDIATIMMQMPPIIVTVEDINAKQNQVAQTELRAQVIA